MEKEELQQGRQGSGAAEAVGKDRPAEWNESADMSKQDKAAIAAEIGEDKDKVVDVKSTGGLSGRDDYAGSSGDGMEGQSTRQATDV
jgi:hypothetical protein